MESRRKKELICNMTSPSTNKASPLWVVLASLVLGILLVVGYKFKDYNKPKSLETIAVDKACDLRVGACISNLPSGGKISFSINPSDIPLLKPLTLRVNTEGINISDVDVDFIGIGMEMGFNRAKLTRENNNNFKGSAMLPICSKNKMNWEARVLLQTDKGMVEAPFRFHTLK